MSLPGDDAVANETLNPTICTLARYLASATNSAVGTRRRTLRSGALLGFRDASHGSHAKHLRATPNEGITSAVGARVVAELESREIGER